ncbi:MAG: hypothetical protein AAGK23_11195 [Pseudomonadota bacterium]
MFNIEDRSWISRSTFAESAEAEISFCLATTFNPDPNSLEDASAIALPGFVGHNVEGFEDIPSSDVVGNEQRLINHYKAVLRLADQHGQTYNEFDHHMWLRLHIGWEEKVVGFPWYDTLELMENLFSWLSCAVDGDLWSDAEEGWEMIVLRSASNIHFRWGGFDQGGEHANIAFPRESLLSSISILKERIRLLIDRLAAEIGEDYWSRYPLDLRPDLN